MVKYDKQTPVGYAAYCNALKCLDEISSLPGVDLSRGVCPLSFSSFKLEAKVQFIHNTRNDSIILR